MIPAATRQWLTVWFMWSRKTTLDFTDLQSTQFSLLVSIELASPAP
jgi:hypothetical protein